MKSVAVAHNDGLLVLDEMGQAEPDQIGPTAYMLASGQAKARSNADGSLRARSEWRLVFISNGEITLSDHMRASRKGERTMAGQELRLLEIAADAGRRNSDGSAMGIWEDLHGLPNSPALALAMKAARAGEHYGHAGPKFVEAVTARRDEVLREARVLISAFVASVAREGDGQVQRAAQRFGAVAAAGEMATLFGLTGWPSGTRCSERGAAL